VGKEAHVLQDVANTASQPDRIPFARIARFDRAYLLRNRRPERSWLAIAGACGYHDYQHLVRDYKDFTGMTPPEFDRIERASPERRFGLSEDYHETRQQQLEAGAQQGA
jgi:AraC-like DNA-binding protein